MNHYRGLTLLETLCASVLLTMIAATCIPMMQSATQVTHVIDSTTHSSLFDLSIFVDQWLDEQKLVIHADDPPLFIEIPWLEGEIHSYVQVTQLECNTPDIDHTWFVFQCGEQQVLRSVPVIPPEKEDM